MASLLEMLRLVFATLPQLVLSGWAVALLLVAAFLVFVQYRRIAATEAELLGLPKHSAPSQTAYSLLVGLLGGVVGSVTLSLAGIGLLAVEGTVSALLYLWPVSILLGAISARFFCFAYGATLVALSHLIFGWPRVDLPSVLGLVAVLHMVEALLVRFSGATCATPLSVGGQIGEPRPGFLLQRFWPVPLVLPLFSAAAAAPVEMPAWWPLVQPNMALAGGEGSFGWQLIPVVVTMGYADLAISAPPTVRVRQSARLLLVYSGMLLALAVAARHIPPLIWVAALFCGLGHELMAVWTGRVQLLGKPYLRRPSRGVGVLDVLPGSTAALAGLRSGAVILTVEDLEVHNRAQLHEALMISPAYLRIMYRDGHQLEHRRVQRPPDGLFGFGAILLPEPEDEALARLRRPAFFRASRLEN